ncbi:MAG: Ig domain-containing protein [Ekhidna sp.]|nr:Ig domain-containing protein [Ekhidna sp.]
MMQPSLIRPTHRKWKITAPTLPQTTGGDGALSYTLSPSLPQGLTFNAAQRTITGTPEAVMTATEFTYTATDEAGNTAELTFTISVNAVPAFAANAAIADQVYTENVEIADLTLPQATGGSGNLTCSLTKSDGTALPSGLVFAAGTRMLTGQPAAKTAAAAADYTLTATDADGDTDDLTFSITIRAADATPMTLSTATLSVAGSSTTNNTLRLTSSVAWEATEAEDWTTTVTPATGTAAVATAIALTYDGSGAFEPRTGSVTFRETTAGTSPPFEVTLDVTQTAGSSLSTTTYEVPARADVAASVTLDATFGPGVTHWWITAADGGFASTVAGVTSVSTNAGTRAMRNATAFTLSVEENPNVMDRDFELRLHVGEATGEPLSSVPLTVTQAPRPVTLGTTVYEVGALSNNYTITFERLAFTPGTDVTHWWVTTINGRRFTSTASPTSRAEPSDISFPIGELTLNDNLTSRDIKILLHVGTDMGEALFSVPFTVRQRGRLADGKILINNLEQLYAMRYDLMGDGNPDHNGDQSSIPKRKEAYAAAFPDVVYAANRYTGYQLARDLDFKLASSYASGVVNTAWQNSLHRRPAGGCRWGRIGVQVPLAVNLTEGALK